jgi:hypothetical protein
MRKNSVSTPLAISLMAAVLVACGGGDNRDSRGAAGVGASVPVPAAAPIAQAPSAAPDPTRKLAQCLNRASFNSGTVETAEYRDTSGFVTSTVSTRQTISGPVPLNALQVQRSDLRTVTTVPGASSTTQDDFQLLALVGDDAFSYQVTYLYAASATLPAGSVTVNFDQPLLVIPGSLTLGASRTLTSGATMTDSRNNSTVRLNYTQSFTFDAIETVTVAAGVFPNACRVLSRLDITGDFGRDSSSDTRWSAATSGVQLRSVSNGSLSSELVSASFNGVAIKP